MPHVEIAAPARLKADLPKIERFSERAALAARINELSGTAKWVSLHIGADFTVATDPARLSMSMGGDLLSPGLTDEEALEAAMPLIEANCPVALCDLKSLAIDIRRVKGEITDVMLAAYALNPQRPAFDAQALCAQEGIEGFDAHPATALRRLAEYQARQMAETGVTRVYREIELPLAYVLRGMEREGMLVDADVLRGLGEDFKVHITALVEDVSMAHLHGDDFITLFHQYQ
jgi:hypothetical protein